MTATDRIAAAQRILSGAAITPDTAVLAHAILAVAEALTETKPPTAPNINDHATQLHRVADQLLQRLREARGENTPQDAPHATHSHAQPEPVPPPHNRGRTGW